MVKAAFMLVRCVELGFDPNAKNIVTFYSSYSVFISAETYVPADTAQTVRSFHDPIDKDHTLFLRSSGMWLRTVCYTDTNVSDETAASISRKEGGKK